MKRLNWFLLLMAVALPASTLVPRHLPESVRPDLFLILVIFLVARAGSREALPLCWLTGLAKDLLSAGPLGEYAMLYLACGWLLLRVRGVVNTRFAPAYTPLAFLAAFGTEFVYAWTLLLAGMRPTTEMFRDMFTAALVTAAVTPVVVWFLDRLGGWLVPPQSGRRRAEGGFSRV